MLPESMVEVVRKALQARPDVVRVRAGYRFRGGRITDEPVVVVAVRELPTAATDGVDPIPPELSGIPIDVRTASLGDYFREERNAALTVDALGPAYRYRKPDDLQLTTIEDEMRVVCHASPDAGWAQLRQFLSRTKQRLTIGMYELTAPHIVDVLRSVTASEERELALAIQRGSAIGSGTKANDLSEETVVVPGLEELLGNRLTYAWVPLGPNGLVDDAYHIKLAVRDGSELWVSSGSWQSSNQPPHDPLTRPGQTSNLLLEYNREWHAIVEHRGLAETFEGYLRWDLEQARELLVGLQTTELLADALEAFVFIQPATPELQAADVPATYVEPLVVHRRVRVTPILTPDGYVETVLPFIESATERIFFQNQSCRRFQSRDDEEHFALLLSALRDKQRSGVEVRIIVRADFLDLEDIERLKDFGIDTDSIRYQWRCHNKGIIADSRAVLIGSHNWTNGGTAHNRDASLLFEDPEIARYYEGIFEFDWEHLARPQPPSASRIALEEVPLTPDFEPMRINRLE
jgi:PLD-like domain